MRSYLAAVGKAKRCAYEESLERAGKLRNVLLSGKTEGYVKSWVGPKTFGT